MKPITLPAMAAALLFWSAPTAEISAANQPQLGGAMALALSGTALLAAGFARRRTHAAQGDVLAAPANDTHQTSFFRESDMTSEVLSPNGFGGGEVIQFTRARRAAAEPVREDGLSPVLGAQLERQLLQRAERVCGRYRNHEEDNHAIETLEA